MKLEKDILSDICLQLSGRPAENIKTDVEPIIDVGMNNVIFVAKLLRRAFLDKRSCLRRGTVFIRSCAMTVRANTN